MSNKSVSSKEAADKLVKNIRRKTTRKYSAEEKIRIVLAGLRGKESIAALCRRESMAESLYYKLSKDHICRQSKPWTCWALRARLSIAGMIYILRVALMGFLINLHGLALFGTVSPIRAVTI